VSNIGDEDDRVPPYGWRDVSRIRMLVHFLDGPWHGQTGHYVQLEGLPPMGCPGGIYRHAGGHPHGGVIYRFHGM